MRFRLEATEEELYAKGERLVEALAQSLFYAHPELSDGLEKALTAPPAEMKYPVLRELKALAREEYEATLKRMLVDIGHVLDGPGLQKADPLFYDYTAPVADEVEKLYERVKRLALRRGYAEADFEEGGALYGWSTRELLALLHDERAGED